MSLDISDKIFYRITVTLAVLVYAITAFNSHGFYHADEHYQIIEFAGLKTGTDLPTDLAWEYNAQIRPTIQPYICYIIFQTCSFFNITDAYSKALVLRLITALFALLAIHLFVSQTKKQFKNKTTRKLYYVLSYLLWFIPFISVRFSSETWSGLLFLLSIAYMLNKRIVTLKPYILGLLFGLSFLFRFQMAFAMIGLVLWMLLVLKMNYIYFLKIASSFSIILLVGFFIDSQFYGQLVFTPWNYFEANIIDNAASSFGTSPWYYYLYRLIAMPSYPIGMAILIAFTILTFNDRHNLYLWIIFPFVIAHTIIPHKETRFLFPLIYLLPIVITLAYSHIHKILENSVYICRIVVSLLIIINIAGIVIMSQKAAGYGTIEISKYIHDNYQDKKVHIIHSNFANPYQPLKKLNQKFYTDTNTSFTLLNSLCDSNDTILVSNAENLLVLRKIDLINPNYLSLIETNNYTKIKQSVPSWIEWLCTKYRFFKDREILILYSQKRD